LKLEEEGQGGTTAGGDEGDEDDAKRKAMLQEKSSTESAAGRQVCRQRGTGKLHTDRRGDAINGLNRTRVNTNSCGTRVREGQPQSEPAGPAHSSVAERMDECMDGWKVVTKQISVGFQLVPQF
jgi:hypothetical protein